MRIKFPFPLLGAVLLWAGCASTPEKLVVGRWQDPQATQTLEFRKDGTWTARILTGNGQIQEESGTYDFPMENRLRVENPSKNGSFTERFSVDKKRLQVGDETFIRLDRKGER